LKTENKVIRDVQRKSVAEKEFQKRSGAPLIRNSLMASETNSAAPKYFPPLDLRCATEREAAKEYKFRIASAAGLGKNKTET
jgi:hypothetical protein